MYSPLKYQLLYHAKTIKFDWTFHLLMIFVMLNFNKKWVCLKLCFLYTVLACIDWWQFFSSLFVQHLVWISLLKSCELANQEFA